MYRRHRRCWVCLAAAAVLDASVFDASALRTTAPPRRPRRSLCDAAAATTTAANTVGNAPAITAASVTTSADLTAAISSAGRSAPAPAAYPQPSPVDSLFQERTVRAPPVHTHIFGRVPFWRALDRPLPPTTRLATLC